MCSCQPTLLYVHGYYRCGCELNKNRRLFAAKMQNSRRIRCDMCVLNKTSEHAEYSGDRLFACSEVLNVQVINCKCKPLGE